MNCITHYLYMRTVILWFIPGSDLLDAGVELNVCDKVVILLKLARCFVSSSSYRPVFHDIKTIFRRHYFAHYMRGFSLFLVLLHC